jgi:peptidyl-prolyl cis-trans isomerase C
VSHILVATEEEADDVMARLGEGEEFGVLAMELSTDTGSGANNGILPCSPPNGYVEPFQDATLDATVGEVYPDPVESEFGWHVILVTDRTEPTEEELPTDEELAEGVRGTYVVEDLQEWFNTVMEAADVTVEEEYGTWSPNPPTVTPPVDGSTSTTTSE